MKVNISRYRRPNLINPYKLAKWILFWKKEDEESMECPVYRLGQNLNSWYIIIKINDLYEKLVPERKIDVRIDPSDLWSLDVTLAHIIHPTLVELKKIKHGSPCVDDEDIPENLRHLDIHQRWDWIMSEMIWTFERIIHDYEPPNPYVGNITLKKSEENFVLFDYSDPEDMKRYKKESKIVMERVANGLRLFGKYYTSLWD